MNYEWSEWFEHDGRGCPLPVGTLCLARDDRNGWEQVGCVEAIHVGPTPPPGFRTTPWHWALRPCIFGHVTRYRVRRCLVSEWLAETTSDLPVTEDA
jgi:hypothetical protein